MTPTMGFPQMLLAIKDKAAPQYSDFNILLANDNDVPERRKGLNNLKHDVTVSITAHWLALEASKHGAHFGNSMLNSAITSHVCIHPNTLLYVNVS